ncbi:MAG: hypothetical protein IKJ19_05905 [Clostridia bacterium]|nr:hypothetical protein [Clostridia bacterium]
MNNINRGTVVTYRVRLARNLSGYNFASTLNDKQKAKEIINRCYSAISKFGVFDLYEMDKVSSLTAEQLKEKYVISEALRKNTFSGAVAVDKQESLSVMINEEDHIREQCIVKGEYDLLTAYKKLVPLDRWLNNNLRFCKSEKLGYITACPTNLGSGLRASAMMFLPALCKKNMIETLYLKAKERGLTIRGVFGEGSSGQSYLYQVSNEVTLNRQDLYLVNEVQKYTQEVADIEDINLFTYYNENRAKVQDEVYRAYGILTSARLLSYNEFSTLIANLKMGAMLKIIPVKEILALDDLLVTARPALLKNSMINLNDLGDERAVNEAIDWFRAEYVRNCLKKIIT